jgi:hypothetical protein
MGPLVPNPKQRGIHTYQKYINVRIRIRHNKIKKVKYNYIRTMKYSQWGKCFETFNLTMA